MIFEYTIEMWNLLLQGNKQGILFWGSLYFFLVCSCSAIFQVRIRSWPIARGNLIKSDIEAGIVSTQKSDQNFMVSVLYEYSVDGVKYQGNRLSAWLIWVTYNLRFFLKKQLKGITNNNDDSVIVYYNPHNPQKSFLIKPGIFGLLTTLAIAVLPIFYYWLEYNG